MLLDSDATNRAAAEAALTTLLRRVELRFFAAKIERGSNDAKIILASKSILLDLGLEDKSVIGCKLSCLFSKWSDFVSYIYSYCSKLPINTSIEWEFCAKLDRYGNSLCKAVMTPFLVNQEERGFTIYILPLFERCEKRDSGCISIGQFEPDYFSTSSSEDILLSTRASAPLRNSFSRTRADQIEPEFWNALAHIAAERGIGIDHVLEDAAATGSSRDPNSAVRTFVLRYFMRQERQQGQRQGAAHGI
ncbi:MAG: ribbon-helix-helix domain-containing protein [Azospirillaceae bacterium]